MLRRMRLVWGTPEAGMRFSFEFDISPLIISSCSSIETNAGCAAPVGAEGRPRW